MNDLSSYRSAINDALGRPLPERGGLRVWLAGDPEAAPAPEGFVHLVSRREVSFLAWLGRVAELRVDGEPADPERFRTGVTDALGRPVPADGELRVWLDDDTRSANRIAPPGWTHVTSAREACFLIDSGRVVELSLDHDLSDDRRFGAGSQVIDFIEHEQGAHGRFLWPRDGAVLHTANERGRARMQAAIERAAERGFVRLERGRHESSPRYGFRRAGQDGGVSREGGRGV